MKIDQTAWWASNQVHRLRLRVNIIMHTCYFLIKKMNSEISGRTCKRPRLSANTRRTKQKLDKILDVDHEAYNCYDNITSLLQALMKEQQKLMSQFTKCGDYVKNISSTLSTIHSMLNIPIEQTSLEILWAFKFYKIINVNYRHVTVFKLV